MKARGNIAYFRGPRTALLVGWGATMAKLILPRVHVMVLCDEIEPSSMEEDVFDLRGVRTRISAPAFPYSHPQLCVYLQMTGHEGTATGQAVVLDPETDAAIHASEEEAISFFGPLSLVSVRWRLHDCSFPRLGVYYVQVQFGGKLIHERALLLDQSEAVESNGQATG